MSSASVRHRRGRLVGSVAGLGLLVVVAVFAVRPPSPATEADGPPASDVAAAPAVSRPAEIPAPQADEPLVPAAGGPACPVVASPSADVDGDRCPDPIVVTGSTIQAGAVRYRLGADGDDVTVGDWDCDGESTPALVRPSTGEVFVFSGWATAAAPMSVGPTAVVAAGVTPVAATACGPLQVRAASGAITTVTGEHP